MLWYEYAMLGGFLALVAFDGYRRMGQHADEHIATPDAVKNHPNYEAGNMLHQLFFILEVVGGGIGVIICIVLSIQTL